MPVANGLNPTFDSVAFKSPFLSGLGATRTLKPSESGFNVMLDRATGIVLTLPPPVIGVTYTFVTTVAVTSNSYKIITDAGTTFIQGSITNVKTDATSLICLADGSTAIAITSNGTTTGGLVGGEFTLRCVSATEWQLSGKVMGSGTIATPIATS